MNIGFDFDGVLRGTGVGLYRHLKAAGEPENIQIQGAASYLPLLNPLLFAMPEDKLFCISHCAPGTSANEKIEWLRHFFGDRLKFIPVEMSSHDDKAVAKAKFEKCIELDIGIYIDDNPSIVRHMRQLGMQVMHYGSWITEIGK